jgi:hypothetical protein
VGPSRNRAPRYRKSHPGFKLENLALRLSFSFIYRDMSVVSVQNGYKVELNIMGHSE